MILCYCLQPGIAGSTRLGTAAHRHHSVFYSLREGDHKAAFEKKESMHYKCSGLQQHKVSWCWCCISAVSVWCFGNTQQAEAAALHEEQLILKDQPEGSTIPDRLSAGNIVKNINFNIDFLIMWHSWRCDRRCLLMAH